MINRELLIAKNVVVQGITGLHGSFQAKAMLDGGTNIVAGTTPGKAGQIVAGVPVYDSIIDIQKDHRVDASIIFVPAPFAKSAIIEAATAQIPLIVCITEGIPIHDMIIIKKLLKNSASTLIGPNSPGVIVTGTNKLGIIPANMSLAGRTAIVSRSGTLTYEVMASLTERGIGQRYVIGIGGDRISGTSFVDCVKMFEDDPEVDQIVLIGEIGGSDEQVAARYIAASVTKPVFAYVAGHHAPVGVQMGHAGAISGNQAESAESKTLALKKAGVQTATSIARLVQLVAKQA